MTDKRNLLNEVLHPCEGHEYFQTACVPCLYRSLMNLINVVQHDVLPVLPEPVLEEIRCWKCANKIEHESHKWDVKQHTTQLPVTVRCPGYTKDDGAKSLKYDFRCPFDCYRVKQRVVHAEHWWEGNHYRHWCDGYRVFGGVVNG